MITEEINPISGAAGAQSNPILAQIEYDMGEMLLPLFVQALSYQQEGLENSIIIFPMMQWIQIVVNDLNLLKTEDPSAYNSPSCQSILNFLTVPQPYCTESLYQTSCNKDNDGTANIIYCMEILGTFNSKNGLIGQIRLFLSLYPPNS
ncbi:MAG: hypothetical protein K1X28_00985 [Parachlamydiales bacterium]|nr:hypothetical protein [Parachlamydiales bacterium]